MCMPIRGIFSFLLRPSLWQEVLLPIVGMMLFSVVTLVLLFAFAFHPQKEALADRGLEAWQANLSAGFLMVLYTSVGTFILIAAFFAQVQENITSRLLAERQVANDLNPNFDVTTLEGCCGAFGECARGIGRTLTFLIVRLFFMILLLPLDAVPVFGWVLYLGLNGWLYTWDHIGVFLHPLGYTSICEQKNFAYEQWWAFATYGGVAFGLELLPVVGILFMFSNACGAAFLLENFHTEYAKAREPLLSAEITVD